MTAKELFNINITPLANSIFASKWSEDNHISVITENGIHTFEFISTPLSSKQVIHLERSFIYPSDTLPNDKYTEDVNTFMLNWDREEVYSILMEGALSPKVSKANQIVPRVVDVIWSPKGLVQPNKCLLAMLTSAGAVELLLKISRCWYSIYDLSTHWYNVLQQESQTDTADIEGTYETFVSRARRLQATAVAWSKLMTNEQESYAYFAIAYRSSDLAIWRIDKITDSSQDNIKPSLIVNKINLKCNIKIKIIKWISIAEKKFLLLIGYFDGRIQCLNINEESDYSVKLQNSQDFILESDRIPITYILLIKQDEVGAEVLVVKGVFLIFLRLSNDGSLLTNFVYRNSGLQISGITLLSDDDVLIISENGKMSYVTISIKGIKSKPVKHEIFSNRVRCLGLCSSFNRIIFITITSPNTMYDHLVNREPTTVHFFYIDDERKDPITILMNEHTNRTFFDHWDCLELIRLKAANDNYSQTLPNITHNLGALSAYMLRAVMWISTIKHTCIKSKSNTSNLVYNNKEMKHLIFLHSATAILDRLANKVQLSKDEWICMNLLRKYLQAYLEEKDDKSLLTRRVREVLSATSHMNNDEKEMCNICGKMISDVSSWKLSQCPSGHKLPRCSATLLQVTTVRYRTCSICKLIFHPSLEKILKEPRCLFCDIALFYDPRTSGMKSKGYMKNFSKPSATLKEMKENGNVMDDEDGDCEVDVMEL